jgi:hypothetical protein
MPARLPSFGWNPHNFRATAQPRAAIKAPAMRSRSTLVLLGALVWAPTARTQQQTPSIEPAIVEQQHAAKRDAALDLPPLPDRQASLIGGTVAMLDPVHDRMVVRAFGGKDVTVDFDVRTHILRGFTQVSEREIRAGGRVYVDTILNNGRIFAKTIRLDVDPGSGEVKGQVISYDGSKDRLRVNDAITSQPFALRLSPETEVRFGNQPAHATDLTEGTLVQITFRSMAEGPGWAQKIEILAKPGSTFTFSGTIAVVDLRDNHLTVTETPDQRSLEIGLASIPAEEKLGLKQGMDVVVRARFDGRQYQAQSVEPSAKPQ